MSGRYTVARAGERRSFTDSVPESQSPAASTQSSSNGSRS